MSATSALPRCRSRIPACPAAAAGAGTRRGSADRPSPRRKGSSGAARLRGRDVHFTVGGDRRAGTSSTRSSIVTMSAACCGWRPRCRRSCAAWSHQGLVSRSAIPSPRRNSPPAASSCAASCHASTSNSPTIFPRSVALRRWHSIWSRPCASRWPNSRTQPLNAAWASGKSQILPIAAVPAAMIAASSPPR